MTNLIRSGLGRPRLPSPRLRPPIAGEATRGPPTGACCPMTAICAVQAALSLTLVWSNTAYTDEADYLWVGRLEIAHWLHGTSWPSTYAYRLFPGRRLCTRRSALWPIESAASPGRESFRWPHAHCDGAAVSRSVKADRPYRGPIRRSPVGAQRASLATRLRHLRSVVGVPDRLSAWLIVQAGYRRHRGELIAAAAFALALANVTAYSGIVVDPVVIAFAFLAWLTVCRYGSHCRVLRG